ncbi:MAG TPA: SAM-dependent methyltransferase [Gammaproteobacteria bacterium]
MSGQSKVCLVGAGAGLVELITVKVLSLIKRADVIVYDHLVSAELLCLIPGGTARIIAGKRGNTSGGAQTANKELPIKELLLRLAPGRCVLYLKGGDPAIVGGFAEEAHFLAQHGIDFEVLSVSGATLATTTHVETIGVSYARCH